MYAKVFRQILESSIAEKPELRFTFIDFLILADINGVVDMTHEAIARITNRPLDVVMSTILELESPDPRSRTPDESGARLKRLDDHRDWGWMIINYDRFRELVSEEQKRAKTLARVQKYRKKRSKMDIVTPCNAPVTLANASNAMQRQRQREMQRQREKGSDRQAAPTLKDVLTYADMKGILPSEAEAFWNHFEGSGWIDKNGHPVAKWEPKLCNWSVNSRARPAEIAHHAGNGSGGAKSRPLSVLDLKTIIQTKEERCRELEFQSKNEGPLSSSWSSEIDRMEYVEIRKEIRDLKTRISQSQ